MIALRRHETEGKMHCSSCVPDRQERMGCRSGTVASEEMGFHAGRYKLDRCPLAIRRDMSAGDKTLLDLAVRWAHAKADGSLSLLLSDPSSLALEMINAVEEEWAAQRHEDAERHAEEMRRRGVVA